jgi:hypothetical protein
MVTNGREPGPCSIQTESVVSISPRGGRQLPGCRHGQRMSAHRNRPSMDTILMLGASGVKIRSCRVADLELAAGPGLLPGLLEPLSGTTGPSPYRQVGQPCQRRCASDRLRLIYRSVAVYSAPGRTRRGRLAAVRCARLIRAIHGDLRRGGRTGQSGSRPRLPDLRPYAKRRRRSG